MTNAISALLETSHENVTQVEDVQPTHYRGARIIGSTTSARREWRYAGAYTLESTSVIPKQYVAGFRLAGHTVAGLAQTCRVLDRWETQKREVVYFASEKLVEYFRSARDSSARIAALETENEKLRADAETLRRAIVRNQAEAITRAPLEPEVVTKASEFLVVLPKDYRHAAFSLLTTGRLSLDESVQDLGLMASLHFTSLLGWAEAAYVSGSTLVATRLGRALGEILKGGDETTDMPEKSTDQR